MFSAKLWGYPVLLTFGVSILAGSFWLILDYHQPDTAMSTNTTNLSPHPKDTDSGPFHFVDDKAVGNIPNLLNDFFLETKSLSQKKKQLNVSHYEKAVYMHMDTAAISTQLRVTNVSNSRNSSLSENVELAQEQGRGYAGSEPSDTLIVAGEPTEQIQAFAEPDLSHSGHEMLIGESVNYSEGRTREQIQGGNSTKSENEEQIQAPEGENKSVSSAIIAEGGVAQVEGPSPPENHEESQGPDEAFAVIPYSIMVVTGEAHLDLRLRRVLETWGRPRPGFHLTVVTDAPLPASPAHDTLCFPETQGGREPSQYKWALGINGLRRAADWVLVVDDDAFVVHGNLQRLLRTLDPARRALYGQRCSAQHFCGGAGFLVHWDTLERLRPAALRHCGPGTGVYDVCFAAHMGVEFVELGEFCSQPPAFYAPQPDGSVRDKGLGAEDTMRRAVTFHYITDLYEEMQRRVDRGEALWPW